MFNLQKLPNGLKLITVPMSGTKTVTVLVMIATGSKYEDKTANGISHFLEHLFFKGTKKRPSTLALASELDRSGGEYNAFTGKEYTGFWVKAESRWLGLALEVLADMLANSQLEPAEIEREKGVIAEELNMYLDNPLIYLEDLFEQCLYGNSPAGRDTIGTKENILSFKRADLTDYLHSQYGANNSLVCLAGKLEKGAAKIVSKYFGQFQINQFKDKKPVVEKQKQPAVKLHFKKTDQAHLSLGVRTFSFGHAHEVTLRILAMLLGGSMSSRLFISLRERLGLAYYVHSHSEFYTDSGYLTAQAGVPLTKTGEAIKIIWQEYQKISSQLVPIAELNKAKQSLIGRTTLQLEASDDLANWYARQVILLAQQARSGQAQGKILTPADYFQKIKKVTAQEILTVAKQIFLPAKLNLAVIGPFKNEEEFKKILRF